MDTASCAGGGAGGTTAWAVAPSTGTDGVSETVTSVGRVRVGGIARGVSPRSSHRVRVVGREDGSEVHTDPVARGAPDAVAGDDRITGDGDAVIETGAGGVRHATGEGAESASEGAWEGGVSTRAKGTSSQRTRSPRRVADGDVAARGSGRNVVASEDAAAGRVADHATVEASSRVVVVEEVERLASKEWAAVRIRAATRRVAAEAWGGSVTSTRRSTRCPANTRRRHAMASKDTMGTETSSPAATVDDPSAADSDTRSGTRSGIASDAISDTQRAVASVTASGIERAIESIADSGTKSAMAPEVSPGIERGVEPAVDSIMDGMETSMEGFDTDDAGAVERPVAPNVAPATPASARRAK